MLFVILLLVLIWFLGKKFRQPVKTRLFTIALVLGAVIVVIALSPENSAPTQFFGGSLGSYSLLAAAIAMVGGYVWLLGKLRSKARQTPTNETSKKLSEAELDRYSRHIVMHEVGGPGQMALKRARVLVVGAGGLGAPVLQYLAAVGVGEIWVIDDDVVDASNLQRQVIHMDETIGTPKVQSAAQVIHAQNPYVRVVPIQKRLSNELANEIFPKVDMVIDGTDNFETRYLVNAACVAAGLPLISGALSQWEGQISIFAPALGTPCYQCVFPTAPDPSLVPSCAEAGVFAPLPGMVGTIMAAEAVKLITGAGQTLTNRMMVVDALDMNMRSFNLKKNADCEICAHIGEK